MAGRFTSRRAARAATEAERIALRDSLRGWWSERAALRKKAAEKRRKKALKRPGPSRGVHRVPDRLRGLGRSVEVVVEHTGSPRSDRRRRHLNTGRSMAPATNTPHVNPRRDAKSAKAGRLRKELQP